MHLKDTYNKIAKDWFKDHLESDWWADPAKKLLKELKPGSMVLDVGCGAGLKTKYIVDHGFEAEGIDFSEEMVKLAREYEPRAKFEVVDITHPFKLDRHFDAIFALAVLLHIPKKQVFSVLQNILQHLKIGGYLYVTVKGLRPGKQEERIVTENDYGYEYQRFFSFYTASELRAHLENLKMRIEYETVITRGDTDWLVCVAKKSA